MVKVCIETYGCTMNQSDSDIMRGIVSKNFELVESVDVADVVIINSCGVVDFTERKILKRAESLKRLGKKVVMAGCLPRIATKKCLEVSDALVSPDNVHVIDLVVKSVLKGEKPIIIDRTSIDKSEISRIKWRLRENAIAIVSIAEGCTGRCSFCATRFARGRLRSFKLESIVEEVRRCVENGFKEIQITSQDTGAYGLDKGKYMLPDLLRAISEIEGDFRVRVGMMNPRHAVEMLDDLLNAFESEKIYKFIHVPVQSGDEKVLRDMNRDHSVEDFVEVVRDFRRRFDEVMVSTDVIVGFPTETEEAFLRTYELIRDVEPDIVNITRFSKRPFTPAFKLKEIHGWIVKERSRKLTELARGIGIKRNRRFIGKRLRVLITKNGKKGTKLARTDSYRPVVVREGNIGEFINVRIVDCAFNYLVGVN
ncbi:tRNA (N(6)-L-threonylcarbamoyladenosine(37)-C(2))-methylthiotransferase [Archaeoglobus sp.]